MRRLFGAVRKFLATVGYSGLAPIAPGTAGSAVTAVAYYLLCDSMSTVGWIGLLAVVSVISIPMAGAEAAARGRKDPGPVVIDEALGFLVTMAFLPHSLPMTIAGFLLFRVLDIIKPQPARWLERLPGGWGIVLDDVAAGIWGNVLLRLAMWWLGVDVVQST
ncbi:MAG: phosphatidylglycerophosphatase A [Gemmatimonadetes bacterium]|nr:phosphatidylglycerophosphatase A [Gemmatimonadota bacterium]MBT4611722.1 phosphatidylglycerophosphatase A [Gemmatimonadota bacterium]MBT5056531.1 phosphatidylglycerophosphatase A [Gemmatimonadota bacterium]MBT5145287.1 phosphatidylglycerophosphatase A [Gemmatimonadota bacterium]MBT5588231.1 phosphatidylglycerophosphatase A [Gemmatimonadota bacterium]